MLEKFIVASYHLQALITAWILPFTCILCSKASDRKQDLCSACLQDLPIIAQSCTRCANKILFNSLCGQCLQDPPPFSATHALFDYEQPIVAMILNLKFRGQLTYARIFGELLAEKIMTAWYRSKSLPDLIMPVPLHERRLQERGFNQALELARPIAKALNLKLDWQSTRRLKYTTPQMSLAAKQRQENLKNAFVVERRLTGKNIAIIDDVVTTGATVTEFSRALQAQGAARIDVWCCAKA